jgi:hypothetical protein
MSCETLTEQQREKEQKIEQRDHDANGISIDGLKLYDDAVLQQYLTDAQTRLASLVVLDQTAIGSHVGNVTGASQQVSSFALSALGNPTPGMTITANGPTKQVVDTVSGTPGTVTTTNAPVQNTVTTVPQINAAIPTAPAPTTTLPSAFGVSASDTLGEQMQLTYEIANLRLLLEGAINDRLITDDKKNNFVKPRVTVGFRISIAPSKRFRNAVAVVEAEVETSPCDDLSHGKEAPSITALLPREKTYNVSAITDRTASIGAGVVTQVASVGGSFMSGRKTYYIVKDQDTLASTFEPTTRTPARAGFAWQFRPVLGQDIVQAGFKETVAQVAFPTPASVDVYGTLHLRTYWRKYDAGSGILKGIVPGSLIDERLVVPIRRFNMAPNLASFSFRNAEDLGNGQMLVRVEGRFLGGTVVRVGATVFQPGSPGFMADYSALRFVAPIADLATKNTFIVTRDGTQTPLLTHIGGIPTPVPTSGKQSANCTPEETPVVTLDGTPTPVSSQIAQIPKITIKHIDVSVVDETNSRLVVKIRQKGETRDVPPLVLVIGGKVFGYADAPIERDPKAHTLSVVVPTAFLFANRSVTVKPLFVRERDYSDTEDVLAFDAEPERLVLVKQTSKTLQYLLYGRDLGDVDMIVPKVALKEVGDGADRDDVRFIEITLAVVKTLKEVVLQRDGERPFAIPIPALVEPAKAAPTKQTPKFRERVTVGADDATIIGDGLKDVVKIVALKQDLTNLELSDDGKSLKVKGLAAAGITAAAKTVDCDLVTKAGKSTIQMEVVSSKVESVQK